MEREQTTLRLPSELKEELKRQAQERGDSFNETVVRYLNLGIEYESRRASIQTQKSRLS